ncbi:hypothetical protein FG386_002522 [Cryptosporidium ryanae]|uniref:uncharacterized protein n=1 Tax=Cryptosporidium ryanae TaxID=515981 RepID=UPI00351A7020|nr:hypothetical protein FG386_002522 [Cryptosporidium ryanae]
MGGKGKVEKNPLTLVIRVPDGSCKMLYIYILVSVFLINLFCFKCEFILDPLQYDIQILKENNFDAIISKNRKNYVSSVYFYASDNVEDTKQLKGWYNDAARELKGMVKICAIDCTRFKIFCDKIGNTGKIIIYPVLPIPSFEFSHEKSLEGLKKQMLKYIPRDNVSLIGIPSEDNQKLVKVEDFLTTHISVPKVLIFSEKESPPTIIHSLANEFNKKLLFGFIPNCKSNKVSIDIAKKYKINTFPRITIYKDNSRPLELYKGDIKFLPIFEFLNIYAETFVMGGGFSDQDSGDQSSKPWLIQRIPELTGLSYYDICGKHKGLCVIYLKNGNGLSSIEQEMLEDLQDLFTPHISGRGANFRWMWMDISSEPEYDKLFNDDGQRILLPSAVVLGTNKRLKFTHLPRDIEGNLQIANKDTIKDLLDKVTGGDARFVNVPGQKLPNFSKRVQNESSNYQKDEL